MISYIKLTRLLCICCLFGECNEQQKYLMQFLIVSILRSFEAMTDWNEVAGTRRVVSFWLNFGLL